MMAFAIRRFVTSVACELRGHRALWLGTTLVTALLTLWIGGRHGVPEAFQRVLRVIGLAAVCATAPAVATIFEGRPARSEWLRSSPRWDVSAAFAKAVACAAWAASVAGLCGLIWALLSIVTPTTEKLSLVEFTFFGAEDQRHLFVGRCAAIAFAIAAASRASRSALVGLIAGGGAAALLTVLPGADAVRDSLVLCGLASAITAGLGSVCTCLGALAAVFALGLISAQRGAIPRSSTHLALSGAAGLAALLFLPLAIVAAGRTMGSAPRLNDENARVGLMDVSPGGSQAVITVQKSGAADGPAGWPWFIDLESRALRAAAVPTLSEPGLLLAFGAVWHPGGWNTDGSEYWAFLVGGNLNAKRIGWFSRNGTFLRCTDAWDARTIPTLVGLRDRLTAVRADGDGTRLLFADGQNVHLPVRLLGDVDPPEPFDDTEFGVTDLGRVIAHRRSTASYHLVDFDPAFRPRISPDRSSMVTFEQGAGLVLHDLETGGEVSIDGYFDRWLGGDGLLVRHGHSREGWWSKVEGGRIVRLPFAHPFEVLIPALGDCWLGHDVDEGRVWLMGRDGELLWSLR